MSRRTVTIGALAWALAGCAQEPTTTETPAADDVAEDRDEVAGSTVPGDADDRRPFAEIGPAETVEFTGTEPFWGGKVTSTSLTYSTPENIDGATIAVERFAGRGGISYSGTHEGAPFDMMITPGECSDGMTDRTYPYTVTLEVQGEQRRGCAWTEDKPRTAPPGYDP